MNGAMNGALEILETFSGAADAAFVEPSFADPTFADAEFDDPTFMLRERQRKRIRSELDGASAGHENHGGEIPTETEREQATRAAHALQALQAACRVDDEDALMLRTDGGSIATDWIEQNRVRALAQVNRFFDTQVARFSLHQQSVQSWRKEMARLEAENEKLKQSLAIRDQEVQRLQEAHRAELESWKEQVRSRDRVRDEWKNHLFKGLELAAKWPINEDEMHEVEDGEIPPE
jgi:hypothetical protein